MLTKDRWGALPILFALVNSPDEIIELFVESYQSLHSNYVLDWSYMVETLARANAVDAIKNLENVRRASFPSQIIDWDTVVANVSSGLHLRWNTFRYLARCSVADRVDSIGVKQWRDNVTEDHTNEALLGWDYEALYAQIMSNVAQYEAEYQTLKEAVATLELAIWKAKLDESRLKNCGKCAEDCKKKPRTDDPIFRNQCRLGHGADIIVQNVIAFSGTVERPSE